MSKLSKLKLALLAVLTLTPTGKDHDKCLCFVTAFRSFLPVQLELETQFMVLAFVGKQAGCLVSFSP